MLWIGTCSPLQNFYRPSDKKDFPVIVKADDDFTVDQVKELIRNKASMAKGQYFRVREVKRYPEAVLIKGGKVPSSLDFDAKWYTQKVIFYDTETTGFSYAKGDRIVEMGFAQFDLSQKKFVGKGQFFLNPDKPMPPRATEVNGITDEMLKEAKYFEDHLPEVINLFDGAIVIAHNVNFDNPFVMAHLKACSDLGLFEIPPIICSLELARRCGYVKKGEAKLVNLIETLGVEGVNSHRAEDDAVAGGNVFLQLTKKAGIAAVTVRELLAYFDNFQ